MLFFLQRLPDPRCHFLLLRTKLEVLCFGERTFLGKKCTHALHKFAAQIVFQRDHYEQMTKHECGMTKEARNPNDEGTVLSFRAKSRMKRLGKPRHGREGQRLSEREVSESNPVEMPIGNAAGSFDSAWLRSG